MGTLVRVVLYARTAAEGDAAAQAAFDRIAALDARLSDYRDDSEVRRSRPRSRGHAGRRQRRSLRRCSPHRTRWRAAPAAPSTSPPAASRISGAGPAASTRCPSAAAVEAARLAGGHARVHLDAGRRTVTLATAGVALDVGGIAKGYAADAALRRAARAWHHRRARRPRRRHRGRRSAARSLGVDRGGASSGRLRQGCGAGARAALDRARERRGLDFRRRRAVDDRRRRSLLARDRPPHRLAAHRPRRSTTVLAPRGLDADALSTAIGVLDDAAGAALPGAGRARRPAGALAARRHRRWRRRPPDFELARHHRARARRHHLRGTP